jgi:RNA polymerase sigma factor (sigma-70 family)
VNDSASPRAITRELIVAAQSGTDDASPALDRLLTLHEGLCKKVVTTLRPGPPDDDLVQIARIAFVQAVRAYRVVDSTSFATFAYTVMYRAVLKEAQRQGRSASRLNTVAFDEIRDVDSSNDGGIAARLQNMLLRAAISAMPNADRALLRRLYWEDRSQREVAAEFGVSQAAVYKRHARIISDLRMAVSA